MKRSDEQRCKGNSNQHITTSSGNPIKSLIRAKTRGFNGALTIKLLNSQTIFIIMSMVRRKTLLLPIIVQDRVTLIYANHRVETKMLHPIRGWQSHWRAAKKSPQKSKCNKIKTLLKYHPFTQTILKRLKGKTHSTSRQTEKARTFHWADQMNEILITWVPQRKIARKDKAHDMKKSSSRQRILTQKLKMFLTQSLIKNLPVSNTLIIILQKNRKKPFRKDHRLLNNLLGWKKFRINQIN